MRRHDEYEVEQPYVVIERRSAGVGSFLIGLALGAGLALFLAPASGEETRQAVRRRARRVGRVARNAAEELSGSVGDRYEEAKRRVEETIEAARHALELKRRQAGEAIRAGREAAQQARLDLEARIAETKAAYRAGADTARATRRTTATAGDDQQDETDRDPNAE